MHNTDWESNNGHYWLIGPVIGTTSLQSVIKVVTDYTPLEICSIPSDVPLVRVTLALLWIEIEALAALEFDTHCDNELEIMTIFSKTSLEIRWLNAF